MKLSKITIEILKNFATINPGIIIKPGNRLVTMNVVRSMFADATIPDEFPVEFAIYDLNELLTSISAFDNPEVEFYDDYMKISGESDEVEYRFSQPSVVVSPGDKKIQLPSEDRKFVLTKTHQDRLSKFSSIHKLKELRIDRNSITLLNRNGTGNKYKLKLDIECETGMPPSFLKIDNLNFIPVDYTVAISTSRIARFCSMNSDYPITYFVTLDANTEE